jgi:hypothetical protein
MPSIRETAVSAGLRASRRFSGSPVVYTRGNVTLSVASAVKRSDDFVVFDEDHRRQIVTATTWRVRLDDLDAIGLPAVGDTITDEDGVNYIVDAESEGVLHWAYTDTGQSEITINTRLDASIIVSQPQQMTLAGTIVVRP